MGNIMWGIVFLLAGVVLVWLGIRQRKRAQRDYEDDVRRYTASTVMTVVHLDTCIFVDHGMLRKNEFRDVMEDYKCLGRNVKIGRASCRERV